MLTEFGFTNQLNLDRNYQKETNNSEECDGLLSNKAGQKLVEEIDKFRVWHRKVPLVLCNLSVEKFQMVHIFGVRTSV